MTPKRGHGGVNDGFEPSARVVMIGAGQLARMTHQAAIEYGIDLHVLAASANDPAVTAGAAHTLGRYDCYRDLAVAASLG
ncbi:MAG: 5-(carboxyamino)imidazole ribonucleotide synthase, partial [Acidimicrobiales bacterium]